MVEELLEEDGLCIMSPGMGLHQVAAVLLRLQDARLRQPGQSGCGLVLGAAPWQREALRRELRRIDPVIRARVDAAATAGVAGGGARQAGKHGWAVLHLRPPLCVGHLAASRECRIRCK
jgi:hypothetical protein